MKIFGDTGCGEIEFASCVQGKGRQGGGKMATNIHKMKTYEEKKLYEL